MPQLFSRIAWGARPARSGPGDLTVSRVKGIAIHWPAMSKPLRGFDAVAAALRSWQAFHMDGKGWSDIAYQVAVDQDGNRYELRGLRTQSGANGDNDVNEDYGALLLILAPGEQPTDAMVTEVRNVVRDFRAIFPNGTAIKGHSQVRPEPTACPGPIAQAAINAGEFEPVTKKPKPLVQRNRTRVAAVNMHAPGPDDAARMERALDRFRHLGFTLVALSEFNAEMARVVEAHPKWFLHRAKPNSGTSGNALLAWSPVFRCLDGANLRVDITDRRLTMAGAVFEHKRTGLVLPTLAIHNPTSTKRVDVPQSDRDTCLAAERKWADRMLADHGRALVLGDFNQPAAMVRPMVRGAAHTVDQVYGRGVTFSSPEVHEGFRLDGITDHPAISALIRVTT